jgi:hypothetical protein
LKNSGERKREFIASRVSGSGARSAARYGPKNYFFWGFGARLAVSKAVGFPVKIPISPNAAGDIERSPEFNEFRRKLDEYDRIQNPFDELMKSASQNEEIEQVGAGAAAAVSVRGGTVNPAYRGGTMPADQQARFEARKRQVQDMSNKLGLQLDKAIREVNQISNNGSTVEKIAANKILPVLMEYKREKAELDRRLQNADPAEQEKALLELEGKLEARKSEFNEFARKLQLQSRGVAGGLMFECLTSDKRENFLQGDIFTPSAAILIREEFSDKEAAETLVCALFAVSPGDLRTGDSSPLFMHNGSTTNPVFLT